MNISKIWTIEQEILNQIDAFCRKHDLKYSLAYGTLLGAIRHGGFIPWDDDVDIIMPRADYEYLLANWDIPGYILQNKRTNNDFNQTFTKIRKDHTAFIQFEYEKEVTYHTGIFVDVFPADRVAPEGLARKQQFIYCAVNLLYSREFTSGGNSSFAERVLLSVPRKVRLKIRNRMERKLQKWDEGQGEFFNPSTIKEAKIYFPPSLFDQMIEMEFEGKTYMCTKEYEVFLRTYYGDYMQLPPEDKRTLQHHPLLVDFEHNYGEI